MTALDLLAHVKGLAERHGITVDMGPHLHGMMFVEEVPPRIETPTFVGSDVVPTVELAYLVALHEIGHCVLGHTQGRPPFEDKRFYFDHGVLRCEAEAWNYALDVSLVDPDLYSLTYIVHRCLGSYIRAAITADGRPTRLGNGNRHHVEFVFDDPNDEYVTETLQRLRGSHELLKEATA